MGNNEWMEPSGVRQPETQECGVGGTIGGVALILEVRKPPATPALALTSPDELGLVLAPPWLPLYKEGVCTAWAKPRPILARAAYRGRKGGWSSYLG